jgi:cytochrome c oxidase assembly protein subunit 15
VALTTLAGIVWTMLDLRAVARGERTSRLTPFAALTLAVLVVQLFFGALVAGLRAGTVAGGGWLDGNVWPLMQGRLFPAGIDWSLGVGHALVADPYLVHFLHRWWAWLVVIVLVLMGRRLRALRQRPASVALHSAFGAQILLGIATVMSGVAIPLAVLHQLIGALLVAATAWSAHALGRHRS